MKGGGEDRELWKSELAILSPDFLIFPQIHVASAFNGEHPFDEADFEIVYNLWLSKYYPRSSDKAMVKNALLEIPVRGRNRAITKDPTGR